MSTDKSANNSTDEIIIMLNDWKLSISKSEKSLSINSTSYHPFNLTLSRKDLLELVGIMDKMNQEKK